MNIPQEIRYRPYNSWSKEDKQQLIDKKKQSPWLATYHIEAETGLLNDPNGFSYFDGKYHLFYQNWPFGAAHGLKSWVHTTSIDLVTFTPTGTVLYPDTPNDSHGAYSGSAYPLDDRLFLFYTGNVRDTGWHRTPLQIGAYMQTNGIIDKITRPLITPPTDCTEHFRDPQIFEHKGQLYAIIGAQNHDQRGFIKVYKAVDNNIENIYPNTYKIAQTFDTSTVKLENPSHIFNLDYGFDCYATQAFNSPDGRVLAVSWIGLPDIHYPTDTYDYQGAMSLVKELSLKDGKLYQFPVKSLATLRHNHSRQIERETSPNTYELEITVKAESLCQLTLFADNSGAGLIISINTRTGTLTVDRSQTYFPFDLEHGQVRQCPISKDKTTLNIFIDQSIFEIFVNQGESVLTGRYFPSEHQSGIIVNNGIISGHYYEMRSANGRKTDRRC